MELLISKFGTYSPMQPDLTPKQQTSEALRQGETILITTGQNPSVDQVTAVLALTAILRKFGKKVSAIISDPLPSSISFLDTALVDSSLSGLRDFIVKLDLSKTEVDKLRYEVKDGKLNVFVTPFAGGFSQSDVSFGYGDYHYDLAVVLGVPNRARLDRVFGDNPTLFANIPVLNVDNHRSNENFGAVNLIEPTASSLCEILVALSESLQTGLIDADIATTMLAGLISSTDRFGATHTTSKSLTVAAQLMAAGGRQQAVMKGLYGGGRSEAPARSDRPARDNQADRPRREAAPAERSENARPARDDTARSDRKDRDERGADRSDRPAKGDRPIRSEAAVISNAAPLVTSGEKKTEGDMPAPIVANEVPEAEITSAPVFEQGSPTGTPVEAEVKPLVGTIHPQTSAQPEISGPFERAHADADVTPLSHTSLQSTEAAEVISRESSNIDDQPIIEPQHVELDRAVPEAPVGGQSDIQAPHFADFQAALEVLHQSQIEHIDGPLQPPAPMPDNDQSRDEK